MNKPVSSTFDPSTLSRSDKQRYEAPLTASIKKVTRDGKVEVDFSNYIMVPGNYTSISGSSTAYYSRASRRLQSSDMMQLKVVLVNEALQGQTFDYSWSVISFEPLSMRIQIRFEDSLSVSQSPILDKVEIRLLPGSFSDTAGRTFPSAKNL